MSKNYFAIERNGECLMPVILADHNGNLAFEDFLEMSYEKMKLSDNLEDFVVAAMDAANQKSESRDEQTMITLVGEDGCFVWGILMGPGENDNIQYALIDWQKDGKHYRYEP